MLAIDPEACIDRNLRFRIPMQVNYAEDDWPQELKMFAKLNSGLSPHWPAVSKRTASLPGAEAWKAQSGKLALTEC